MNTDDTGTRTDSIPATSEGPTRAPRRPGQTLACGWCGSPILVQARGRAPKWCSSSCRHRAWELTRAATSGRAAVQVVDRVIEVEKPVTVIEQVPVSPRGPGWTQALANLVAELDTGRVYDRDLPALGHALQDVIDALERRPAWRRQPH